MRTRQLNRKWNSLNRYQKRRIIQEAKQRVAVQKLIKEEMLMIERHVRTCDIIAREERRMISEGYTADQINEGIMDFLGKIPGSYMTYLKQYFAGMLIDKLGFDQDSLFGTVLKNTIENMEIMNITKYFGKGGCEPFVGLVLESFQEALQEQGLDMVMEKLFGRKVEGFMSGTGREMLMNAIRDFTDQYREPITKAVCGASWTGLVDGMKGMFSKVTGGMGGGTAPAATPPVTGGPTIPQV